MFEYIKGTLVDIQPSAVVIECQGIAYKILIPCSALSSLPNTGETLQLFTNFVVRENSQTLFGFLTVEERELFSVLIAVSGIGPKLGLSIIGHFTPEDLQSAIADKRVSAICRVPGIGKKTAERLIIEVKDRLASTFSHLAARFSCGPNTPTEPPLVNDAVNALINLGYKDTVANKAVKLVVNEKPEITSLPVLITESLKSV